MARALAITLLALTLALVSSWPSNTALDAHEHTVHIPAATLRR